MILNAPWKNLLSQPTTDDHIVQTYKNDQFLISAVGLYIGKALNRSESVIAVATSDHWAAIESRLLANNIDLEKAVSKRQLFKFDAAEMLAKFMVNGMPDSTRFNTFLGNVLDTAGSQNFKPIRVYGEMVNLLWLEGNVNAAIRLEELWNELRKLKPFSLFCAYTMDSLDKNIYGGVLQQVCDVHSHVIPAEDYLQFEEAVAKAFMEVVHPDEKALHTLFDAHKRRTTHMPNAQSTMLWLKEHLPFEADKVIDRAKQYRRLENIVPPTCLDRN